MLVNRKDKILQNMVKRGKAKDLTEANSMYIASQKEKGSKGGKSRKTIKGFTPETASEAGKKGAEKRWAN